jgi:Zn-dependent protease with chaperone function
VTSDATRHANAAAATSPVLEADYFDGRSARARRARLRVEAGRLVVEADDAWQAVPLAQLEWPERTRHGVRLLHLPDGGSLHCRDGAEWDAWSARVRGGRESLVVRVQQRWRWTLACLFAVVAILAGSYRWGLPLAAGAIVSRLPTALDEQVGEAALSAIDEQQLVGPSTLAASQQEAIRRSFSDAVARLPGDTVVPYRLQFRHGRDVGPNAFALPGGVIVVTDELVELVHGEHDVVVGVLGHELGHLQHRHGMRMLIEAGAIGAAAGALFGDFSSLLAAVPTWVAQAKYSRDAEREADLESVHLLRANGISPAVMTRFFALVRQGRGDAASRRLEWLDVGLASHPADAERVAFFQQAAAAR